MAAQAQSGHWPRGPSAVLVAANSQTLQGWLISQDDRPYLVACEDHHPIGVPLTTDASCYPVTHDQPDPQVRQFDCKQCFIDLT
jgi:hypothetical protein